MKKVRFAIIGTNFISDWVIKGAREDSRFELVAVYSRNRETAENFAGKHSTPLIFTSLEELAGCSEVDAVYIASPNSMHARQSIMMMKHGKHVLCEKPLASTAQEVTEMIEVAHRHGVTLMEAMKPTLTPNFGVVLENLSRIGKIRQYVSSFCQYSSRYDRYKAGEMLNAFNPELASGAMMDVGIYTLYPLVILFGRPESVLAYATLLPSGVDGAGTVILQYKDFTATLIYSKIADAYLPTEIQGEEGTISLDKVNIIGEVKLYPRKFATSGIGPAPEPEMLSSIAAHDEYFYEIQEFINLIEQGRQQSEINSWENSLITLEIIDEIRHQIGVRYSQDGL